MRERVKDNQKSNILTEYLNFALYYSLDASRMFVSDHRRLVSASAQDQADLDLHWLHISNLTGYMFCLCHPNMFLSLASVRVFEGTHV